MDDEMCYDSLDEVEHNALINVTLIDGKIKFCVIYEPIVHTRSLAPWLHESEEKG